MSEMISVVIPVFNEEQNVSVLYKELSDTFAGLGHSYEIIFVDDGSADKSPSIIRDLARGDKRVKAVIFRRNHGQTSAIAAGIDFSGGDYILTIDADLQNDPKDIGLLLQRIREGYDLVSGWRKNRKEPFLTRRLPSIVANRLISALTGLKLHDYGCTLKLYRRSLLKNINLYGEMHRFIPAYVQWAGGKITEVEVKHRERRWGKSKYGISRTLKVIFDLITVKFLLGSTATSPLYFFGGWGMVLICVGAALTGFALFQKLAFGIWVHKNPLLLLAIFSVLLGAQAIFMGLLAELSVRIYYESTKKSIYSIDEKINC